MRRLLAIVSGVIGCGPLVVFDDGDSSDGDGSSDSPSTTAVEGGMDGIPPDPSGPIDATSSPDSTASDTIMTTVSTDETTSGPVIPGCGDGELGPGEQCDDGNYDDGDACSSICTSTFEIAWTATYDGPASLFDVASDVVVAPDGAIYVVGSVGISGAVQDVWLQQYFADGTPGWTWTWNGLESLDDEGKAIAVTQAGHIVIAGSTASMATGADILVLAFDPLEQVVVWSRVVDGPGTGPEDYDEQDYAEDVAIAPNGDVIVVGTTRVGAGDSDPWLAALAPDTGVSRWTQTFTGPGTRDRGRGVYVRATGDIVALFDFDDEADTWLLYFHSDGVEDGLAIDLGYSARAVALRADGGIASTGIDEQDFGQRVVVSALDDGLNPFWSNELDGSNDDDGLGVAAGPSSEVAAVGTKGTQGRQGNAWIRGYTWDGQPWWGDTYGGEAGLEDTFNAVTFDGSGGVIAVGSETVLGQQTNALVRMYLPL